MRPILSFLISAFAVIALYSNNTPDSDNVKFHSGSFESGLRKASSEGKLLFVEFYANWCTPCKWMDKTTFRNSDVITKLNTDYVALKLDIESDQGLDLKNQYQVRMLPTILIFDANGQVIDRVEKTLSAESMVSLLSVHENTNTRISSAPVQYNTAPASGDDFGSLYSDYQKREVGRTNYKLQVGNYTDYVIAFDQVKELKEIFIEPIVVINDYVDNSTHYKVMLGEFKTIEEAESFRKILDRDFNITSIVH